MIAQWVAKVALLDLASPNTSDPGPVVAAAAAAVVIVVVIACMSKPVVAVLSHKVKSRCSEESSLNLDFGNHEGLYEVIPNSDSFRAYYIIFIVSNLVAFRMK